MDVGKQVVKGVFWGSLAKFITALLYGALLILIPRYLGKENFGYYSLTLSIITFFGLFVIAGVGTAAGRFIAATDIDNKKQTGTVIFNGLLLQLVLGLILASLLLLLTPVFSIYLKQPLLRSLLPLGALYLFFWGLVEYFKAVFVGLQKLHFLTYQAVVENLSKLLLAGGGVILLGFGPAQVLEALILALLLAFVFAFSLTVKGNQLQTVSFKWLKDIFFYSLPMVIMFAAIYIFFELDSIMIAYFHGVKATGAYNAALQFVRYLSQIVTPLGMVLGPTVLKLKEQQPEKLAGLISRSLNYVLLLFLPISLLIFIAPGAVLRFLFGSQYLTATSSFRIMAIFALTLGLGTAFSPVIDYLGLAPKRAKYMVLAVSVNVLLNFLLIPKFGGVGAALATALTHTPYILANIYLVGQNCQVSLRPLLLRALLIVVLASTIIAVVNSLHLLNQLLLGLLVIGLLYLLALFSLKLLTFAELKEMRRSFTN